MLFSGLIDYLLLFVIVLNSKVIFWDLFSRMCVLEKELGRFSSLGRRVYGNYNMVKRYIKD